MRRAVLAILAAAKDTLVATFVDPVRQGSPRPATWPRGLPAIGAGTLALYALLGLATIFAEPIRQTGYLILANTGNSLPSLGIPLLMFSVILCFTLAHTAALHCPWWLSVLLFLLSAGSFHEFVRIAAPGSSWSLMMSAGLYLALLVFTVIRSRSEFVWWEFVVVAALVGTALLLPWISAQPIQDMRALAIERMLVGLFTLSIPALLVAGSASAQIVATGATAAASRPFGKRLFWILSAGAVAWLATAAVQAFATQSVQVSGAALGGGLIEFVLVGAGVAIWLKRGNRRDPDPPGEYPTVWSPWLYPLAALLVGSLLLAIPINRVFYLVRSVGGGWIADAWNVIWEAGQDVTTALIEDGIIGAVLLVVAWRISARGRTAEASLLGALAVSLILNSLGLLPGLAILRARTTEAIGLIAAAVALVAAAVCALRGTMGRDRAVGVLTVVLLAVLYPHRNLLADPAGVAVGFSVQLAILFGLTWRIFTTADLTQKGSRRFPQPTRVLLFLANSLLAVNALAFVALSRAAGTDLDMGTSWDGNGDFLLGTPMFTMGLVAGTWLVLRPGLADEQEQDGALSDEADHEAEDRRVDAQP